MTTVLTATSVRTAALFFKPLSVDELWRKICTFDNTYYEIIQSSKPVKPYFDVDDCTGKMSYNRLYAQVVPFLCKLFNCKERDWAVTEDCRRGKRSFHLVLTTKYTTVDDLIRLKNAYKNQYKKLKIDFRIYSRGYQKFRTALSRHETDKNSIGLTPLTMYGEENFHHHLVTVVPDECEKWVFQEWIATLPKNKKVN